jgi:hypothetical protein
MIESLSEILEYNMLSDPDQNDYARLTFEDVFDSLAHIDEVSMKCCETPV